MSDIEIPDVPKIDIPSGSIGFAVYNDTQNQQVELAHYWANRSYSRLPEKNIRPNKVTYFTATGSLWSNAIVAVKVTEGGSEYGFSFAALEGYDNFKRKNWANYKPEILKYSDFSSVSSFVEEKKIEIPINKFVDIGGGYRVHIDAYDADFSMVELVVMSS